ncbi:MAG: type I-E CRISPR-associated protein Cse2/CasB [Erysipelotrichaceae bacterium]|nr:type I-E CRISPR-associated protein Cse2/CasB [Erysipelotrichaceae bacterium]
MNFKDREDLVYKTTKRIIKVIESMDDPSKKAILAKLRHSIGRSITEYLDILKLVYANFPEEILDISEKLLWEEDAIISALQLFALHKQGKKESVIPEDDEKLSIGASLRYLRNNEDSKAVDKRFNGMIVSATYEEFKNHLRHLIKLLKARVDDVKVDYALLAKNLFTIAVGNFENVKLTWARDFYYIKTKGEANNESKQ